MRRIVVPVVPVVLAVCTVCAVLAPTAGASPVRTVSATYLGSGVDSLAGVTPALYGSASGQGGEVQAVTLAPQAGEAAITVALTDKSGRPVLAAVVQHLGQEAFDDLELGRTCAGTPGRFRLAAARRPVTVYLLAGSCPSGPSLPTSGTVTVQFSRG